MAPSNFSISSYVRLGMKIEMLYSESCDDDKSNPEPVWFVGKVKKVRKYGKEYSTGDKYVETDILFEDGEYVKKTRLYDSDFGTSEFEYGAWRFHGRMQEVVSDLYDTVKEYEELDDIRQDPDYEDSSCDETEEYSDDDENSESNIESVESNDEEFNQSHESDEIDDLEKDKFRLISNKMHTTSMYNAVLAFSMAVLAMTFFMHVSIEQCTFQNHKGYICRLLRL